LSKNYITILSIPLNKLTRKEASEKFVNFCNGKKQVFTSTPNAEIILEAQKNEKLKKYLQECELNMADSVSLLWASMVQKFNWSYFRAILELLFLPFRKHSWNKILPEQVCGSDVFYDICKEAENKNKSIFLLGASEGVAEKTKNIIQKKYPKLKIVGAIAGSPLEKDDELMIDEINKSKPDILFLAYGCPKQEMWIYRNLKKCTSVYVACGIGGTFDFVIGKIKRAPKIIRSLGFEWLWRLIQEPKRFKRIFRAVFVFPYIFLKNLKK